MRKLKWLLVLCFSVSLCGPAFAQSQARPLPKDAKVIEDLSAPPQVRDSKEPKDKPEPTVTTRKDAGVTISEYRIRGKLYQQKVQPESGPAYYLIDEKGDGKFARVDGPDLKFAVPMWVLLEW
ncbi:MAG: DUF2782 domain-containing protein [Akkermansiaceae bacterium]|nr:DUF2782 domain-containing protein [Verrucomicrobiales bacterium]